MFVNVLNRSNDKDITATIQNESGRFAADAAVWQMNETDFKATNTFGAEKVRPRTSMATMVNASYTFPAHSLTILRPKRRAEALFNDSRQWRRACYDARSGG